MTTYSIDVQPWNGVRLEARTKEDLTPQKALYYETHFEVFRVTDSSDINIGRFSFASLPGCNGVVVSYGTYLTDQTRHTGLSNPFRQLKEHVAHELGYTAMLCTTNMANIPAVGNLFKSKYKVLKTFTNKSNNHLIALGFKEIP